MKGLGARIRALREQIGQTQSQFAESCGATVSQVSSWERDTAEPPASFFEWVGGRYPGELHFLLLGRDAVSKIRERPSDYGVSAEMQDLCSQIKDRPHLLPLIRAMVKIDGKILRDAESLASLLGVPVEVAALVCALKAEREGT
jgi:transcriptional regulator with XRE-family HTH domain